MGAARTDAVETVASRERLVTQSAWVRSGVLRLRREVQVETRAIEITVRREVLTVEFDDYLQPPDGTILDPAERANVAEPPVDRPAVTIVLHEEIPSVNVEVVPYEAVTARTSRVVTDGTISGVLSREQIVVESAGGHNAPDDVTP